MIASLPMYLRPETEAAHQRYWQAIHDNLSDAGLPSPSQLTLGAESITQWRSPNLVLSQTCGRPYRLHLRGKVTLVGTPDYGLDGCAPGYYRSPFVVRRTDTRQQLTDFQQSRFAYNEEMSQSGWAAPQTHVAPLGFQFTKLLKTGGHLASAKAVADGQADIAALDAVTWRMIQRHDEFAANLRVLDWTSPTPGLPYIAAPGIDQKSLFTAIAKAIRDLSDTDRQVLYLKGLTSIPASAYRAVPNP